MNRTTAHTGYGSDRTAPLSHTPQQHGEREALTHAARPGGPLHRPLRVASGIPALALLISFAPGCADTAPPPDLAALSSQVADVERAFAKTMADRDHAAFVSFLAEEAVFFTGAEPYRGKEAVAAGWKPFYEGPDAPFSWEPERVEVLPSGSLAFSTGPVFDASGARIAVFNSIWRLEKDGRWRVVFDRGCDARPPAP